MSYMALPKEVPKIEVKQVEKVVEAGLSLAGEFWFAKTTYHLVLLIVHISGAKYRVSGQARGSARGTFDP